MKPHAYTACLYAHKMFIKLTLPIPITQTNVGYIIIYHAAPAGSIIPVYTHIIVEPSRVVRIAWYN